MGIPSRLFLAFGPLHMGLAGLWWGLTFALLYGASLALWYVYRTDWPAGLRRMHHHLAAARHLGGGHHPPLALMHPTSTDR